MKLSVIIFTIFVSQAFGRPGGLDFLGDLQNKGSDGNGKALELIPKGGLEALFRKILHGDSPLRGIGAVIGAKDGGPLQILGNIIRSAIAAKTQGGKESSGKFDIGQILRAGGKGQGNDGLGILYRTRNGNRYEEGNSGNGKNGRDENDDHSPRGLKNEGTWKNENEGKRGDANEGNKRGRNDEKNERGEDNRSSSNRSYDRSDSGREENGDEERRDRKKNGEWTEGVKSNGGKGGEREEYDEGGKGERDDEGGKGERDNESGRSENHKGHNEGGKGERPEEYNEGGKGERQEEYNEGGKDERREGYNEGGRGEKREK